MISVCNVSKSFGRIEAVKNVSFVIERGEVAGLLGPNGAGKTTLLRLITGFFPPSDGTISIDGQNLLRAKPALRKKIGYLAEHNPLYYDMTARDFLYYTATLKGVPFGKRKKAVHRVVDRCGLGPVFRRLTGKLSKGFQQRVGLAQALLDDPALLILDEPTRGLDPKQIIEIRTLIQELGCERTVLLSTHILPEVKMTCQKILILNEGRLVASGTAETLEKRLKGSEEFRISIRGARKGEERFLSELPGVIKVTLERESGDERDYLVVSERGRDVRSLLAKCILDSGLELLTLKAAEWNLEDIFLKIVTQEPEEYEVCSES